MKVTQDALLVEASAVSARPWSRGGADSSLENNNAFFSEPKEAHRCSRSHAQGVAR